MKLKNLVSLQLILWTLFHTELTAQTLQIICEEPLLEYNDHVGNEWGFGVESNKVVHTFDDTILLPFAGKSKIRFFVQEIDTYTEEVSQWLEIDPSILEYGKTYTKRLEFVVRENMGRYAGNTAKWVLQFRYQKINGRA